MVHKLSVEYMDRTLGLRAAVGFMVGIVIGSGIFASPGYVLADVGSPGAALIVWAFCGLMTLAGALSMAELTTAIPMSGGESVYLSRAFYPIVGFEYTWITGMLAKPAGQSLIAIVFADYVLRLVANCEQPNNEYEADIQNCTQPIGAWGEKGVSLGAIWFLACLQIISTKVATITQVVFTFEKLFLVAVVCFLGSGLADGNHNLSGGRAFENTSDKPGDWALAITNCLFAYNGWNNLNLSAGEVKKPARTIPLAVLISLPLITLCYVWVNASYMLSLPLDTIKGGKTLAVDVGLQSGYKSIGDIIAVGVALSAFGALNGSMFGGARLVHACGVDGTFPSVFGWSINILGKPTPIVAIVSQATISSTLIAAVGSFTFINKLYIFAQWLFYLITMLGLLRLRQTARDMHRPFRVYTFIPVMFVISASFVCSVLLWQSPLESGISFAVLAGGIPFYFLMRISSKSNIQGGPNSDEAKALLPGENIEG